MRDLLQAVLAEEGYRVLAVDHAPDPVDVAQLRPDLIVLDLVLGEATAGWRLLEALRDQAPTARLPVVVCTADHALVRREAERLRTLIAGVVLKPFDLDELLRTVETC